MEVRIPIDSETCSVFRVNFPFVFLARLLQCYRHLILYRRLKGNRSHNGKHTLLSKLSSLCGPACH